MSDIYQAEKHLSRLIDDALSGKDVIISRAGKALVRLVPFKEIPVHLKFGLLKGQIQIADDFNAYSPEIQDIFEGYSPS